MTRDANDLAKDHEIRERQARRALEDQSPKIWGTLSLWLDSQAYVNGEDPDSQSIGTLDFSKPGLILVYDENWDVEIFVLSEKMVFNFVRDRDAG